MKVNIEGFTKAERKHLISQFTLVELFKELHRRAQEDEEEGLEGEEGKEFKFESVEEAELALSLLKSWYPNEVVRSFAEGMSPIPKWLQKELLERRAKKDA